MPAVAKKTKTATKKVTTKTAKTAKAASADVEVKIENVEEVVLEAVDAPVEAPAKPAKKATKRVAKPKTEGAAAKKTKRKAKYIILYSPFLMRETKHELIGEPLESANGRQQWARCAVSHHSQLVNLDALEDAKAKNGATILLSREDSKEYSPKGEYAIGDVIYHKTWDDVGIIRSKEIMSNGRAALLVHFEKNKEKRLVENLV
ncbi:MAG: hypothetical protein SGJ05_01320 [bacterium]|nr:hypothetical protein [bacterium]